MVELLKEEGDDEDAILGSGGGCIEDCQDGRQVSKVPLGNPAGEGAVFLPLRSVITVSIWFFMVQSSIFSDLREF